VDLDGVDYLVASDDMLYVVHLEQVETVWIVFLIFSTPSDPGLQVVFYMAASLSKARARRIPRDVSSSDESSHEVLEDANILPRQFSLMSPRLPRLHSIKGPFKLVLGGILVDPPRSRTRWTPFKLIERLPGQLHGQFRFNCDEGYVCRPLTLVSGGDTSGAWRKVYSSVEYPRLVFKLMPSTEDMSYTTERSVPLGKCLDYTAQFVQEFHCWVSLCESEKPEGAPHRTVQQVHFHILVCERLVPLLRADLQGLDSEEVAYRLALAIAGASQRGFRLRDCGKSNWGFGMRICRLVPLLLDGNSWVRLEPDDPLFGKWPPKKLIGSFWPLLAEIHPQAASEIEQQVYWPVGGTQFDAERICAFLLRRLAGLDEPQQWNSFR